MIGQVKKYCLFIITLFVINSSFAQTDTLFWFAVPYGTDYHDNWEANIVLTATDMDDPTNIIITQPYNQIMDTIFVTIDPTVPPATADIAFNAAELSEIMNNTYIQDNSDPNPRISNCAIKIQADREITAYYEYQRTQRNNDIFSLKGTNAMGQDFWVPFQDEWNNHNYPNDDPAFAQVIIAATEPNTEVTIDFPLDSYNILASPPSYTFTLDEPGMTMMFVPERDAGDGDAPNRRAQYKLDGMHITSDEPIVVTVNDDSAEKDGWDMIGDQLVPVRNMFGERTIGLEYVVMKGEVDHADGSNEKVFVLTTEDNTTVQYQRKGDAGLINLGAQPILQAGTQRQIDLFEDAVPSNDYVYIIADKPIYVFHVSGFEGEMGGALVPTIDGCTGSLDVSFVRAKAGDFYLTIMTHADALNYFEISDNGGAFVPFLDATDFEYTGVGDFYVIKKSSYRINTITQGVPTRIRNTKNVFHLGVINEGPGTCEYGYFSDFKEERGDATIVESGTSIITQCYGQETELKASGGLTYSWTPTDYLDDPTSATPNAFLPVGIHNYQVNITRPCFPDTQLNVAIQIYENTEAYFTLDDNIGCAPFQVEINNLTLNADTFLFDFEDDRNFDYFTNTTGTINHTYNNTTSSDSLYTLKLYAYDKMKDCPDIYTKNIRVFPEIDANFTEDLTIGCNPLTVNFTDLSSSPTSDEYKWDFGDGESYVTSVSPANVTHEFKHFDQTDTVDFFVELVATSPYFCRDTARETISVYSYLESEFTIDTAYGCSPFRVKFTNISAGEDSVSLIFGDGDVYNSNTFNILSHTYTNTSTVVDSFPVELRAYNDEGCLEIWRDTIVVYPEFEADYDIDGNSYVGCNERNVIFTNTTSPQSADAASIFLWDFGDGTNSSSSAATVSHNYDNNFSSDHDYIFTLHAESKYGCSDDTTNLITIHRAEARFSVDVDEGCSPLEVSVTNSSIGSDITNWDWDYGDSHTEILKNPFPYTYSNTTAASITNKLLLEVTGTNGCSSRDSVDITVYPEIKATYDTTLIRIVSCDSLMVEFDSEVTHPGLAGSALYTWDFGDGASSSEADPTYIYRNLASATPIPYTVSLHVETPLGCFYDTTSQVVVDPLVSANIFTDKSAGCSPLSVDVIAQNYIGNNSYSWDYGDATGTNFVRNPGAYIYPANQSYIMAPAGDDNYELILEVEDGTGRCVDRDTVDITVYSEIVSDFNPQNVTDCNPYTVNFTDISSANAVDWQWDFRDGSTSSDQNPVNTFVNTGSTTKGFNVQLGVTSDRGCTDSTNYLISVLPYVESDFDIDISEGCSPFTVTITNNSLSSGTEWYWYWDKDDRIINTGAADSTVNFGTFTKTYINNSGSSRTDSLTLIVGNGNGCYEIYKRAITVHSTIDAEFDVSVDEGCNPLSVQFTNNTVNGSVYNWNFGDGSSTTTASPIKLFTNTTTTDKPFTVRLTAESAEGCVDTEDTVINVFSKVISDFSIATSEGCPPFTTTIENTSIGNAANTYQWLIDDVPVVGAPINTSNFEHTYENTNTVLQPYEVKLIASNSHGCTSEHTDIVTVYEYVEASFSMDVNEGCTPLVVDFDDLSSVPTETKYTWTFGDGASSGLSEPDHTFYNSSRTSDLQRTINLTVQSANYCSDDTSLTVDIYHQPLAKFYIDKTSSCPPLQSTITKLSEGEDSFEWRFGDGNTSTTDENFTYSWDNTDIDNIQYYNLELWVGTNNNCVDSTSLDVTVFPKVTADFTISDTAGCSPLENVQFTNTSTSPATQFFWTFGDGSYTNIEDPVHDFTNITSVDRVYDIYLRASSEYNCFDDTTQHITVYRQPDAEFYIDPNYMIFPENTVGITNMTNPGPFDFNWEFGDINNSTSTAEDPNQFEYEHWGEKIIELTVTSQTNSDCFDYFSDTAIILPPKVNADFTTDKDGGCVDGGLEVQFTAAGSAYNEEYQYDWEFGDGETDQGQYVTHVYEEPGAYYVKLTARSNEYTEVEEDYAYKTIYAYANPEVNFEVSPKLAMLDPTTLEARVKFYNLSTCNDTSGCAYTWDFGDGETAISTDVTHGYKELGKFDVSLTAVSVHGCRDSLTLYEEVEIIGAGQIAFPNAFTPDGYGPPENETFKPLAEGVIEYELFIYNRWGELIFTTKDLSVGWDGTINGEMAKPDVYVWKAQGKYTNGKSFELAGDVTLIR